MDKNFIKDNRVFPEEMHASAKKNPQANSEKNHSMSVIWWILGLLALLVIVFFLGLWAGKQTTQVVQDRNNNIEQERRQENVEKQRAYNDVVPAQERNERLRTFFGE